MREHEGGYEKILTPMDKAIRRMPPTSAELIHRGLGVAAPAIFHGQV